jgi:hypothetical protein
MKQLLSKPKLTKFISIDPNQWKYIAERFELTLMSYNDIDASLYICSNTSVDSLLNAKNHILATL